MIVIIKNDQIWFIDRLMQAIHRLSYDGLKMDMISAHSSKVTAVSEDEHTLDMLYGLLWDTDIDETTRIITLSVLKRHLPDSYYQKIETRNIV